MYKLNEKLYKKLKQNVIGLIVIGIIFAIISGGSILLIIFGRGKVNNLMLFLIIFITLYGMYHAIYSLYAYKIPTEIVADGNSVTIKCMKKTFIIEKTDVFERNEGVNNIILCLHYKNRKLKLYLPNYGGNSIDEIYKVYRYFNVAHRRKVYNDAAIKLH